MRQRKQNYPEGERVFLLKEEKAQKMETSYVVRRVEHVAKELCIIARLVTLKVNFLNCVV